MSLPLSRYNAIRERLIFLYNICNNRTYPIFITPEMMMSIDELRDRPEYKQEDFINDSEYYQEYQERRLTIPKIIDILPNLVNEKQLGFRRPTETLVEIFESIQEYNQLWCELYSKAPEFPTPPLSELRNLELLAYTIFPYYRLIKSYSNNKHLHVKLVDEQASHKANLMGLAQLLGMSAIGSGDSSGISWISHLDTMMGNETSEYESYNHHPVIAQRAVADSLAAPSQNQSVHNLGEWEFKG